MSDKDFEPCTFVVEGTYTDAKGKAHIVLHLLKDGVLGPELLYDRKQRTKTLRVGHVYTMEAREEGHSIRFHTAKWVCEYEDKDQVLAWQVADRAAESLAAAKAREKKEATNSSALDREIQNLAKAYQQLRVQDRPGFEVWLLHRLRYMRLS